MKYNEGQTEYINTEKGTYELKYTGGFWEVTYSPESKSTFHFIGKFKNKKQAIKICLT